MTHFYRFVIFLAAFLVFSIQPIMGKYLLPWFGGSPSVWITVLLFFQALLFCGYLLAAGIRRLPTKTQLATFGMLALLSLILLPITPENALAPLTSANPTLYILGVLGIAVGPMYLTLSAASPLLQAWSSETTHTGTPYRLYVWSNAGSLLGLLSYPVIVEPFLTVQQQTIAWSFVFAACAIGLVALAWQWYRHRTTSNIEATTKEPASAHPSTQQRILWLLLPFLASSALLAITNYITQDIASVPFLWILPLAVYLLSFIITFSGDHYYDRPFVAQLFLYAIILGALLLVVGAAVMNILMILLLLMVLGVYCIVCHGELYARKPDPRYLTSFYVWLSAGGALGGVFVGIVAPLIFPLHFEYHVSLILGLATMLYLWIKRETPLVSFRSFVTSKIGVGVSAVFIVGVLMYNVHHLVSEARYLHRDFFGSLRIFQTTNAKTLYHGKILHGMQFTAPDLACWPTTYYGHEGGLGKAAAFVRSRAEDRPVRVGVVGLGVGTAAVYGDYVRFYELNPTVEKLAETEFTYLSTCGRDKGATITTALGDGRLSLEQEQPQNFDLLILDAFSSDAIPVHLLTKEAFTSYRKHLAPFGVIAVHISNNYIDLKPVIGAAAKEFDLTAAIIEDDGIGQQGTTPSTWAILSTDKNFFEQLLSDGAISPENMAFKRSVLWTDAYSNILTLLQVK